MARRKLFGAALKAWRKARGRSSSKRSAPARTVTKWRTRTVKVRGARRRSSSGGGFKPVESILKAGFVAGGVLAGSTLAGRLTTLSPMARAGATFGAGAVAALLAGSVSGLARRVPLAGRYVTPGSVQLLGLGLMADGVRRAFDAAGGFARLRSLLPGQPTAAPRLPTTGAVAMGPRRSTFANSARLVSRR